MKHETGICYNCGADRGLHQSETMQCPGQRMNGIEETRFDKLQAKFYPRQWQNTIFEDSGLRKLHDAAPELLEALKTIFNLIDKGILVRDISKDDDLEYFAKQGVKITNAIILMDKAIKKATE